MHHSFHMHASPFLFLFIPSDVSDKILQVKSIEFCQDIFYRSNFWVNDISSGSGEDILQSSKRPSKLQILG